jgi:two-component system, OmpR family, sensor histidine kinase KdpD
MNRLPPHHYPPPPAHSSGGPYIVGAAAVILITMLGKALQPHFDLVNIALSYLLPVLITAVRWGLWPSLATSVLSMLFFDFFFVPPFLTLTVADFRHLLNLIIFLVVALVTGTLAGRLRSNADLAREGERRTSALYALSHRIAAETDLTRVLQTVVDTVAEHLRAAEAVILMPGQPYNALMVAARSPRIAAEANPVSHLGDEQTASWPVDALMLDHKEKSIAQWVFEHRQQAGQGTTVLARSGELFIPIHEAETSLAVMGLQLGSERTLSERERRDVEAFASLTALAITRMHLAFEAEQAKWLAESEKLHRSLLNAVSHDLRTPLSSITGAVTGLLTEGDRYDPKTRDTLLETIRDGAQRMNRFIANLLDMARLESGILKPNREWVDMADLVGVSLKEIRDMLPEHRLRVEVPPSLPLVQADFALVEQVLINLLENAVKYSPPETAISIRISEEERYLKVAVGDQGPPIPKEDYDRIFDKFFRLKGSKHVAGTGLGLSICKGIIEAHGGKVWVEASEAEQGNTFAFQLRLPEDQPHSVPATSEDDSAI